MDNLYYRPSGGAHRRRSFKGTKRSLKFLYPFAILAAVVLGVYLLVQLWGFLANVKGGNVENSATVYVVGGTASKQSFGSDNFTSALSGELLLEGDRIRSGKESHLILKFFNDTYVRMDESSLIEVERIENSKNEDLIELKLLAGNVWVNKAKSVKSSSTLNIDTNYLSAQAVGTVFAVKAGLPESVRVVEGQVLTSVVEINGDKKSSLEEISLGSGQQLIMESADYEAFRRRETPGVVTTIDDSFEKSAWYKWNIKEDSSPSSLEVDPLLGLQEELDPTLTDDLNLEDESEDLIDGLAAPKISFPNDDEVITDDTVTITGTVPAGTEKVVVTSFETGEPNPYILKGFKVGDETFKYIAKYDGTDGNMMIGENTFEVAGIDSDGQQGNKATVTFVYSPAGNVTSDNDKDEDKTENDSVPVSTEVSEDLPAPTIVSINDSPFGEKYILTDDRGVVEGSIGTWAKSVVVNGYKLQEYTPYSGSFTYILSSGFGTLKEGENSLTVYGFDKDGRRGKAGVFVIVKN